MSLDKNALERAIGAAIFDPGAEVGMKHDRTLSRWQTDAVMNVLDRFAALPTTSISEPVGVIVRAHKHTCANVQPGSTVDNKCDCGALDTAGQAIPIAAHPAPSEPVSDLVKKLLGADVDHVSPVDALRLHDQNSAAFPLSPEDVESVLDLIDRAASALTAAEARAAEAESTLEKTRAMYENLEASEILNGYKNRAEAAESKIAELEHRSPAEGWRPIETAPKRGTYLVYQPVHRAGRDALTARVCLNDQAGYVRQSTHWMPIPQPPEAK